jgi:CHAT domain-containing protein
MGRQRRAVASAAFVAGPGLPLAATEVAAASAHYDGADVLVGDQATAAGASRAVERAELVHVAAHYAPRRGNPLFSGFELADGPWFLHDLTRSAEMPSIWVVPSCESSVGEAPVAGELLGLTSVLLGAGVRSVVMSSGLVPDDEITATTMTALHARLATGDGPAAALAAALADAGDTPAAVVLRATLACHGAW